MKGDGIICSTPLSKISNKRQSDLDKSITIEQLNVTNRKIEKLFVSLSKYLEKKIRLELSLKQIPDHGDVAEKNMAHSLLSSFTDLSTDYSSIEKPRLRTQSELDFTNITRFSFLKQSNNSLAGFVVKPKTESDINSSYKAQIDYEKLFKSDNASVDWSRLCTDSKRELSETNGKSLIDDDYNQHGLTSDAERESIIDQFDENQINFLISQDVKRNSHRSNRTINHDELMQLNLGGKCPSSTDRTGEFMELSSVSSTDLELNANHLPGPPPPLNKVSSDEIVVENSPMNGSLVYVKVNEKVEQWLRRNQIGTAESGDDDSWTDDCPLMPHRSQERIYSISEINDCQSAEWDLEVNCDDREDVDEVDPIYDMACRVPVNEFRKEQMISDLKKSLQHKLIVVDNDSSYDEIDEGGHIGTDIDVLSLCRRTRINKERVLASYNKFKRNLNKNNPRLEPDNLLDSSCSQLNKLILEGSNSPSLEVDRLIVENVTDIVSETTENCPSESGTVTESHNGDEDSNDNDVEPSSNSFLVKVNMLLQENADLRKILDNYHQVESSRVVMLDEMEARINQNKYEIKQVCRMAKLALKRKDIKYRQLWLENDVFLKTIVGQSSLIANFDRSAYKLARYR